MQVKQTPLWPLKQFKLSDSPAQTPLWPLKQFKPKLSDSYSCSLNPALAFKTVQTQTL